MEENAKNFWITSTLSEGATQDLSTSERERERERERRERERE